MQTHPAQSRAARGPIVPRWRPARPRVRATAPPLSGCAYRGRRRRDSGRASFARTRGRARPPQAFRTTTSLVSCAARWSPKKPGVRDKRAHAEVIHIFCLSRLSFELHGLWQQRYAFPRRDRQAPRGSRDRQRARARRLHSSWRWPEWWLARKGMTPR